MAWAAPARLSLIGDNKSVTGFKSGFDSINFAGDP